MEERIFFKFNIDIPDIDKFDPDAQSSEGEHTGELLLKSPTDILIKFFYRPEERLDRKIMGWNTDYSYTLLSKFNVTAVESSYGNLAHIDFGFYEYSGMESNTQFQESGFNYFTIRVAGIRLVYNSERQNDSEIYLNGTAFNLVELNYRYHQNLPWKNDEFKWEPTNKISDLIPFHKIKFIPEHRFSSRRHGKTVSIEKEPRLRIKHEGLTENDVKIHVNLLCELYSFYCQKEITWVESKIYAEGKLFYEVKTAPDEENKLPHGIFIWDFIQNPLNLIRNVNAAFLFKNESIIVKIVERFNYATKLRDESKFMILYGLLEQLRNQYIQAGLIEKEAKGNPNRAKEEYDFVLKAQEVDKAIERALLSVVGIITPQQQELFRQDIKYKAIGVRMLSMSNQFQSYFDFVKIDPKDFHLDFSELKSLRDKIFHGRKIDEWVNALKKANWYDHLPRLTGVLMLKFFGIDDLHKIEKTKP